MRQGEPADPDRADPVRWAAGPLRDVLAARRLPIRVIDATDATDVNGATGVTEGAGPASAPLILVAGQDSPLACEVLGRAGVSLPDTPESAALVPEALGSRQILLATGSDARGVVYAALELADHRAQHATEPLAALRIAAPVVERPAPRCAASCGCSPATSRTRPGSTTAPGGPPI